MKKIILIMIVSFMMVSCSSSKGFMKKDLTSINSSFKADYYAVNSSNDIAKSNVQLPRLFRLRDSNISFVSLSFDKENDFKISYKNFLGGNSYKTFKGKFKKNYYEIFLEKKRISVPLIYSKTAIDRIRIRVTKDSTLIVENYYNHSGNIFLMAAGSSNKTYAKFNKI